MFGGITAAIVFVLATGAIAAPTSQFWTRALKRSRPARRSWFWPRCCAAASRMAARDEKWGHEKIFFRVPKQVTRPVWKRKCGGSIHILGLFVR